MVLLLETRWGQSYGEDLVQDPYFGGLIAVARVQGQGSDLNEKHIFFCASFAGYALPNLEDYNTG
jgi:hypothetical protein